MARAEALGVDGHLGQRQQRPGGEDHLVADDHRAVVERRFRREDRPQQLGRNVGVDRHAGLRHFLEAGVTLEDDERPMAIGREERRGVGDLVGDVRSTARCSAGENS